MPLTYEEAVERGYDGPPPGRHRPAGCGGYANISGHCGATDCPTCYPATWDQDETNEDEETN